MGKKPNMRDVAGEDHKPEKRGNPGVVTGGVAGGAVKGDSSESGSNSYAKNVQASVKSLKTFKEISKRYKAAKDESSASTREKGRG